MIVGVINLATSAGDKTKSTTAITIIKEAFIALILVLTATQILNIFLKQFGLEI